MFKKCRYVGLIIVFVLWITACANNLVEENKQTSQDNEPIQLESRLKNVEKCYLCGNSDKSMMSYYRQFDTVGIIALNDWYVLDFGLGMEEIAEGSKTIQGNNQGVTYFIEATPSRGMSHMEVSTEKEFDKTIMQKNLCQKCLNKVDISVPIEQPFLMVDFQTLELYSIQYEKSSFFIRDYWVEVKQEERISISAYYLPERDIINN